MKRENFTSAHHPDHSTNCDFNSKDWRLTCGNELMAFKKK